MIPAGSSSALTARSASRPSGPTSASIHGSVVAADGVVMGDRRRRAATIASPAARLAAAPLLELGALAPGGARNVKYSEAPVGIEVGDVAHDQRRRAAGASASRRASPTAPWRPGRFDHVRRGLERLDQTPRVEQVVAQVGPGEAARAPTPRPASGPSGRPPAARAPIAAARARRRRDGVRGRPPSRRSPGSRPRTPRAPQVAAPERRPSARRGRPARATARVSCLVGQAGHVGRRALLLERAERLGALREARKNQPS